MHVASAAPSRQVTPAAPRFRSDRRYRPRETSATQAGQSTSLCTGSLETTTGRVNSTIRVRRPHPRILTEHAQGAPLLIIACFHDMTDGCAHDKFGTSMIYRICLVQKPLALFVLATSVGLGRTQESDAMDQCFYHQFARPPVQLDGYRHEPLAAAILPR